MAKLQHVPTLAVSSELGAEPDRPSFAESAVDGAFETATFTRRAGRTTQRLADPSPRHIRRSREPLSFPGMKSSRMPQRRRDYVPTADRILSVTHGGQSHPSMVSVTATAAQRLQTAGRSCVLRSRQMRPYLAPTVASQAQQLATHLPATTPISQNPTALPRTASAISHVTIKAIRVLQWIRTTGCATTRRERPRQHLPRTCTTRS